jgi:hypothetical protein
MDLVLLGKLAELNAHVSASSAQTGFDYKEQIVSPDS